MTGKSGIADAHFRNPGKGRLERRKQLAAELTVQLIPGVCLGNIATDIGIEQHGVANPVAVLAKATNGDVHVDECSLIHYPEGNRAGSAVFVADQFLDVEIVDPLILGGFAAKSEALAHGFEGVHKAGAQVTGKNAWFRGAVIGKFAGFCTNLHHLALLHDHHALAIGHGDDGAVGDDIVRSLIGASSCGALLTFYGQYGFGDRLTVEKLLPLVGQYAASCSHCCFDQTHNS